MLQIDMAMPPNCGKCPLEAFEKCMVRDQNIIHTYMTLFRPPWCPLHFEDIELTEDEYHRNIAGLSDW